MITKITTAIVLRRTNYGEADKIVNLITPEGKVSAIARGARRQRSKLAGGIELFAINEVVIKAGKSDLKTLISSRMDTFFGNILNDFNRTDFAYTALKVISKKSDNIDSRDFFNLTKKVLESLDTTEIKLDIIKHWFFMQMALLMGEHINLYNDSDNDRLNQDSKYNFDSQEKVFVKNEFGKFNGNHIKFLRLMVGNGGPQILSRIIGSEQFNFELVEIINCFSE